MLKLSFDNIVSYYEKIKKLAFSAYKTDDYSDVINKIDLASIIAYNLNWIYQDEEIEKLLQNLSKRIFSEVTNNYIPVRERVIFYDQIGNATVLTLQYLRALMAANVEFMYILDPSRHTKPEKILSELEGYPKVKVEILDKDIKIRLNSLKEVYNKIVNFGAEKAFIHAPAEGAFGVILWNALPFIKRYRIVPGDHHFYIGTSVTDHCIEFRTYGATLAVEKRGFSSSQISFQQYYPIVSETEFKGFPFKTNDEDIIMLSGGAFYKVLDQKNTFYKILKELVTRYPRLIICFAGSGDSESFMDFIYKNCLQNRIYLLGYRNDINEVVKHCHIYLGTYPIVGGLMSQYAAMNAKPILQYSSPDLSINNIEEIIGINKDTQIIRKKLDQFFKYAQRLIDDKIFRAKEGKTLYENRVTEEIFQENFKRYLKSDFPDTPSWKPVKIDYERIVELYLDVENEQHNIVKAIAAHFKLKTILLFPKIEFKFLHLER
ncbi:MAG: hypothetical protein LIO97_02185, partial [Tannerellaceae bacterium]|nr:hypothetical protein [Tannerellaceae bacterium]